MKKYIAILAVGAIVSPLMAHAAWYNPLSWFERNIGTTTTVSTIAEPEIATTTEEIAPTEPPATSTIQTVVKTVVKTDTVTKYIPDPAVVAENTALKAQIATLTAQINVLKEKLANYNGNGGTVNDPITQGNNTSGTSSTSSNDPVIPQFVETESTFTFTNPINGTVEHPYNIIAALHKVNARIVFIPDVKRKTKDDSSWNLDAYATQDTRINKNLILKAGQTIVSGVSNQYGSAIKVAYPSDYDLLDMNARFPNDFSNQ